MKKMESIHKEHPYIEPIFLMVSSSAFGFFTNIYCLYIEERGLINIYLVLPVIMLILPTIYLIFMSTYSFSYTQRKLTRKSNAKIELIDEYKRITKLSMNTGDISSFDTATYIMKKSVNEIDKLFPEE